MLLETDESSRGIGFRRGRDAYGARGVVEGFVEIAEIAQSQTAHEIGRRIQRVGGHGLVQQRGGLFGIRAFAGSRPVFHGLRKIGLCFGRDAVGGLSFRLRGFGKGGSAFLVVREGQGERHPAASCKHEETKNAECDVLHVFSCRDCRKGAVDRRSSRRWVYSMRVMSLTAAPPQMRS